MTPTQLPLELPHRIALEREDFLVADANAAAVALVDRWPDWPAHVGMVIGPKGSGKSHLGEVWRQESKADKIAAGDLDQADIPALASASAVLVEDVETLSGDGERQLFHLFNLLKEEQGSLLLTSTLGPAELPVRLPDLASRLGTAITAEMGPPDDQLLLSVLLKLFHDRQLVVPDAVLRYLATHMDRSFLAAQELVAALDRAALAGKRPITVPLASRVLSELAGLS